MGVLKVIIAILLIISSLGGVLVFSYKFAQDNPLDQRHQHELTLVEASDPTCDTAGFKAHYTCKGCDSLFADEKGYAPLTLEEVTVNPLGHDFENLSCAGVKKCKTCGAIEGTGSTHTPDVAVRENVVEGTCLAEGSYESVVMCKVCGQEISREKHTTPLTSHVNNNDDDKCDVCGTGVCKDHKPVIDPAVEATCTTDGLSEGSHCGECNTVIVPQKVVPAGHNLKVNVSGTLTRNTDGTHNTEHLVITIGCTECEDYETETITDYTISAEDPFESGVIISIGDSKISYPALDDNRYEVQSTYDGNDKTPTVSTAFALAETEFTYAIISNHCIDLNRDEATKVVYSVYELDKLNNENVTVTYDAEKGYIYSSKQNHTVSYLVAYGADLTVTGDVHVLTAIRLNLNTHLIVGTDEVAGNLKVERTAAASSNNQVIALWQSAYLTIRNGTLTTVGKATANWAIDIYVGAVSSTNPTSNSVFTIEKNGNYVTEGTGEYSVFFVKGANARFIVDGNMTSDRNIVIASNFAIGDEYEYGFQPAFYIRNGNVKIDGAKSPSCISSIQVGSEKENASGTLTMNTSCDSFRMARNDIRMTFAKGTLNFNIDQNDKTVFQTGGDGDKGVAAYRPYYEDEKCVRGDIDFKKDIVVNAEILKGSKNNYFLGLWRPQATYVQNWTIEEGTTFNFTNVQLLYRINKDNNVKLAAYKEAELNIDGTLKTVRVAAKLVGTTTAANGPANLVFPTFDANATWTTDTATAAVNGWNKATDANGNVIYYK